MIPPTRSPLVPPVRGTLAPGGLPWDASGGAGTAPPTITVAPVLTWTVEIGNSPAITPPTYTGAAGTITYTLLRDGAAVGGLEDVSEATLEAYDAVAADIGPSLTVAATVINPAGSDSEGSNAVIFNDATFLPLTAIGISQEDITTADGGTTADSWASSLGGIACTLTAPAATNRPAYSASGGVAGRPLVTFDGVDNVLKGVITKGSTFASFEVGIVGQRIAGVLNDVSIEYETNPAGAFLFGMRDAGASAFRVTADIDLNGTSDPDGVNAFYSVDAITGAYNVRKNGVSEASSASAYTTQADGQVVAVGGRTVASAYANIAIQAWIFGPLLSATQRTHLRALLTYWTGITC